MDTWAEILVPDFYDRICRLFGIPDSTQEEEEEAVDKMLHTERPSGLGDHIRYLLCFYVFHSICLKFKYAYIQYVQTVCVGGYFGNFSCHVTCVAAHRSSGAFTSRTALITPRLTTTQERVSEAFPLKEYKESLDVGKK